MTREEAIQYLKDHYDSVDGGNADWILDKDAEKLINRIYDDFEKDLLEVYKKGFIKGEMHQMGIAQPPKED